MEVDITLDPLPFTARIRLIGSPRLPALWIRNGCFDVAVNLTPDTTRGLREAVLASQGSPGAEAPASQPRQPAATRWTLNASDATTAIDAAD